MIALWINLILSGAIVFAVGWKLICWAQFTPWAERWSLGLTAASFCLLIDVTSRFPENAQTGSPFDWWAGIMLRAAFLGYILSRITRHRRAGFRQLINARREAKRLGVSGERSNIL